MTPPAAPIDREALLEYYKEQLAAEYRETYTGKLDIYGLFYDRGLHWLNSGGTLALISQGSFIDKEWAGPHTEHVRGEPREIMGLRRKLAERRQGFAAAALTQGTHDFPQLVTPDFKA